MPEIFIPNEAWFRTGKQIARNARAKVGRKPWWMPMWFWNQKLWVTVKTFKGNIMRAYMREIGWL